MKALVVAGLMLSALPLQAFACQPLGSLSGAVEKAGYRLEYRLEPAPVRLSQPFNMVISICSLSGPFIGRLKVDADMPVHKHGMNYRPRIMAEAPGIYEASGLLLHMCGQWRFRFELGTQSGPVRLAIVHQQR
ncbi:MAG: hypothetical protein ACKVH0_17825 [Alphaproteobacteria bacterium]